MTGALETRLSRLEALSRPGGVIVTEWRSTTDDEKLAAAARRANEAAAMLIVIRDPWASGEVRQSDC
jgi:hypothetical protein